MKLKTKIVSIALATTLLIGSSTVLAAMPEGTPISVGDEIEVSLTAGSEGEWFTFTPNKSGTYLIYSFCNTRDPVVELRDASNNKLDYDDDGGPNANFSLKSDFTEGETYYIKVRDYSSYAASFTFSVIEYAEDYGVSFSYQGDIVQASRYDYDDGNSSDVYLTIPVGGSVTFNWSDAGEFTPYYRIWNEETEIYEVVTGSEYTFTDTGDTDTYFYIYSGCADTGVEYDIKLVDLPTIFVNSDEVTYDHMEEVAETDEQGENLSFPAVNVTAEIGTDITLGVEPKEEIDGLEYFWGTVSENGIETIDGATDNTYNCGELEPGEYKFIVGLKASNYLPVVFVVNIVEHAPEPTPEPAPAPETPSAPAPDTRDTLITGFVERLYLVALDRSYDSVGRSYWIDQLLNQGNSGSYVARGFFHSQEFLGRNLSDEEFVTVLYRVFFDREPDAVGFANWTNALANNATRDQVIDGFAGSIEWQSTCARFMVNP